MAIPIPAELGSPVTTRVFSWREMAIDAWGEEFFAPDHGVYVWSSGRKYDSTDQSANGFYRRGISDPNPPIPPILPEFPNSIWDGGASIWDGGVAPLGVSPWDGTHT
jgi:hypothetical protein